MPNGRPLSGTAVRLSRSAPQNRRAEVGGLDQPRHTRHRGEPILLRRRLHRRRFDVDDTVAGSGLAIERGGRSRRECPTPPLMDRQTRRKAGNAGFRGRRETDRGRRWEHRHRTLPDRLRRMPDGRRRHKTRALQITRIRKATHVSRTRTPVSARTPSRPWPV